MTKFTNPENTPIESILESIKKQLSLDLSKISAESRNLVGPLYDHEREANQLETQRVQEEAQRQREAESLAAANLVKLTASIKECEDIGSGKLNITEIIKNIDEYSRNVQGQFEAFVHGVFNESNADKISAMFKDFSGSSNKEFGECAGKILTVIDKITDKKVKEAICEGINKNAGLAIKFCVFCLTHTGLSVIVDSIFNKDNVKFARQFIEAEKSVNRPSHTEVSGTISASMGKGPGENGPPL